MAFQSNQLEDFQKTCAKSAVRVISSRCAVWSCENNKAASPNVTYYQLPICDNGRCAVWLLNANRIDLVNTVGDQLSGYVICSKHFDDSEFVTSAETGIRHLARNAIPTLFGSAVPPIPTSLLNRGSEKHEDDTVVSIKNPTIKSAYPSVKSSAAKCCSCKNTYKESPAVPLFYFPVDDLSRFCSWVINCGQTSLLQKPKQWVYQNRLLCAGHFESFQFEDEDTRVFLKPGAIPTLFASLEPTIPAPTIFNEFGVRPVSLALDKIDQSEMDSPKLMIVNTMSLAEIVKPKIVSFKVNVPNVSILNPKPSPKGPQIKKIQKNVATKSPKKATPVATKLIVKPIGTNPDFKAVPDANSSTVLIDSTGKTNSDHPLANVISMFLAHNKGHTGDLLITDGTPNGAKYLIRQNKVPGSKETPPTPSSQTSKTKPKTVSLVSSQTVKNTPKTPPKASSQKTTANTNLPPGSSEKGKGPGPLLVDLRTSPPTGSVPPSSSPKKMVLLKPSAPNQNGLATSNGAVSLPGSNDTVTMLVPVSLAKQLNLPGNVLGSGSGVAGSSGPVTMLLPMPSTTPGGLNRIAPKPPGSPTSAGGVPVRMLVPVKPTDLCPSVKTYGSGQRTFSAAANKKLALNNPQKTTMSEQQKKNSTPFTIVKKNTEATKQNGTTTCKSTFVIRGNGPLSSDQLEAIVRENLLKTGTIKDGAKILIRHKGALPSNQGPDAVKNGTFTVQQNKMVPMAKASTAKKAPVPKTPAPKAPAPKTPAGAKPTIDQLFDTQNYLTPFRYPKGMSPNKLIELRKNVRKHLVKICRQKKLIEKLKLEKKDKVKNLPSEQLVKLVRKALPGFAGKFFEAQLHTSVRDTKKHGHRWDEDSKVFALGLWNRSPAAFKLMQRAFALPSLKTLNAWVASVPPEVDFFEKLKEVLERPPQSSSTESGGETEGGLLEEERKILEEQEREMEEDDKLLEEELVQPVQVEEFVQEEQEEEPLHAMEEEPPFPDEEEEAMEVQAEQSALIEKVCIDLDHETGMQIVEEVVQDAVEDADQALVESLILAAQGTILYQ